MPRTAPDCARFTILGEWAPIGQIATILEMEVNADTGSSRNDALLEQAERISDTWITTLLPQIPNNYTHQTVEYLDLDSVTGPTGSFSQGAAVAGGQAGDSTPPNIGPLLHKNLTNVQRGGRAGRMYLPGILESDVGEGGLMLVAEINTINTAAAAFLSGITVVGGTGDVASATLVVVQWPSISVAQPSKKEPDPDGVGVPVEVLSLTCDPMVGSQRRRLRR